MSSIQRTRAIVSTLSKSAIGDEGCFAVKTCDDGTAMTLVSPTISTQPIVPYNSSSGRWNSSGLARRSHPARRVQLRVRSWVAVLCHGFRGFLPLAAFPNRLLSHSQRSHSRLLRVELTDQYNRTQQSRDAYVPADRDVRSRRSKSMLRRADRSDRSPSANAAGPSTLVGVDQWRSIRRRPSSTSRSVAPSKGTNRGARCGDS